MRIGRPGPKDQALAGRTGPKIRVPLPLRVAGLKKVLGNDLLSQRVTPSVPSALEGLTAVFGMGTGVSPPPLPPNSNNYKEGEGGSGRF